MRPDEALRLRGGETGRCFAEVLTAQLLALNPGVVEATRAAEVIRQLTLLAPSIQGNRDALGWLRGEGSVFVPAENRERNVALIDFGRPDRNVFQITDEWRYKRTVYANRADVVFLINGIPIAIAETKGTSKANGMEQGVTQIRRYHAFDSWAHLNQLLEDWLASEADQRCHGTLKEVGESRGERPRALP